MDYKSSIDLLKELIAIPSFSKEEKARADFLCRYLRELGFEPQRVGNNLWCTAENIDDSKPNLLLNSHIDTVRPSDSWTRRPFVPQIEGDRLYGLGRHRALNLSTNIIVQFLIVVLLVYPDIHGKTAAVGDNVMLFAGLNHGNGHFNGSE
jgi:acetylornithine deacetylase